jgi:hypothetical protein
MTESTMTRGANIRCRCGREPFADNPALVCFDLRRFNSAGEFADSPAPGDWYCPEHAPAKSKRSARVVRDSPLEALTDFELLLADAGARLSGMFPDGDNTDDLEAAFDTYRREIDRGLSHLRGVIARYAKPVAKDKPKSRGSKRKTISATEDLPGQTNLLDGAHSAN